MQPAGENHSTSEARDAPQPVTNAAAADETNAAAPAPNEQAGLKFAIDIAPLAIWLTAFHFFGLIPATAVLIGATLVSLVAARVLLGKISPMLIVTAVLVTVFGGLTVGFNEPRFIKVKPTVVNLLFAGALGYGLVAGKNFLKMLLGEALQLTAVGWRLLTIRWIWFFIAVAIANEFVWRTYNTPATEHLWGYFKFPGIPLLTVAFTALQLPLLSKHAVPKPSEG